MIELLRAAEVIRDLPNDPDPQGTDLVASGPRCEEAAAAVEAPRGTLIHHDRVDRNDQVTLCKLIVSTTCDNRRVRGA